VKLLGNLANSESMKKSNEREVEKQVPEKSPLEKAGKTKREIYAEEFKSPRFRNGLEESRLLRTPTEEMNSYPKKRLSKETKSPRKKVPEVIKSPHGKLDVGRENTTEDDGKSPRKTDEVEENKSHRAKKVETSIKSPRNTNVDKLKKPVIPREKTNEDKRRKKIEDDPKSPRERSSEDKSRKSFDEITKASRELTSEDKSRKSIEDEFKSPREITSEDKMRKSFNDEFKSPREKTIEHKVKKDKSSVKSPIKKLKRISEKKI